MFTLASQSCSLNTTDCQDQCCLNFLLCFCHALLSNKLVPSQYALPSFQSDNHCFLVFGSFRINYRYRRASDFRTYLYFAGGAIREN